LKGRKYLKDLCIIRRDNIKADCKEIDYEDVEWIRLAEGTVQWWELVGMAAKLWVS
jgi:hypothetical protein